MMNLISGLKDIKNLANYKITNMNNFDWGDDIINSRDINSRYEDLKGEYDALVEALEEAQDPKDIQESQEALDDFNSSFDKDEMDTLAEVISEGEKTNGWWRGVTLINENYFTTYTKDLIDDTQEEPEELDSTDWPWNHLSMDYDGAAEELKQDYYELEVSGHTYLYQES